MKGRNLIMGFLCLSIFVVIPLLVLFNFSWAQCPEAPMDLGICDTLYVEQWAHTDTCFDGDCSTPGHKINTPGSAFPCFLYISLFVTHDSSTFYWGAGGKWVQDSLATFVLPLNFWHQTQGGGGNLISPTGRVRPDINPLMKWNNTTMTEGASQNRFTYSIFRHLVDENGDTIYNRFAQMDYEGWTDWTVNQDLDTLSSDGDSGHVFTSLVPASATCERWWEGSRVLVATYTFKVSDSMHVYLDSTFWTPSGRLSFIRYDAGNYIPRHDLPLTLWIGPPRIEVISPNGGEIWLVGETHDITWFSEDFTGPNVKLEFSTDAGSSWMPIINSTPNDGVHPWIIPNNPSTHCKVRISDAVDGVPSDVSDGDFTISRPPRITVTSPNGGETWFVGHTKNITWLSENFTGNLRIEYTTNGGDSWMEITPSTENDGIYSWIVENTPSTDCLVEISDASDGEPYDESDGNFSIVESGLGESTADSQLIEIGTGGTPKWSPDGTKLAFMSGGWLSVANADGSGEIQRIVQLQPWTFDWMSDSEFVVSDKIPWTPPGKGLGHKFIIETVDMKGEVQIIREDSLAPGNEAERQYVSYIGAPFILNDGTVGYYEIHEKPGGETKIFKVIKQGKLEPDSALKQMIATTEGYPTAGEIWLESVDGTVKKKITPGKKYLFPVLSPDNTKILAGAERYAAGIVILNLKGEVLTDLDVDAREISPGLIAGGSRVGMSWSPDGKKILYNWTVDDGHMTYDKDIYMVNADGTGRVPIAATPNDIEKNASWSPDGTKIAYRSETSGKIFVVKLK
jgi:hypothetical protein